MAVAMWRQRPTEMCLFFLCGLRTVLSSRSWRIFSYALRHRLLSPFSNPRPIGRHPRATGEFDGACLRFFLLPRTPLTPEDATVAGYLIRSKYGFHTVWLRTSPPSGWVVATTRRSDNPSAPLSAPEVPLPTYGVVSGEMLQCCSRVAPLVGVLVEG